MKEEPASPYSEQTLFEILVPAPRVPLSPPPGISSERGPHLKNESERAPLCPHLKNESGIRQF